MNQDSFDHDAFGESSLGMDPKLLAALSYIPIVGLIFFFIEQKSTYVRFHAAQSVLVDVVLIAVNIVLAILGWILVLIPFLGALAMFLLRLIAGFGGVALLVIGAVHAWNGRRIEFPIVGQIAGQLGNNRK